MSCAPLAACLALWMGAHGYDPPHQRAVLEYVHHESGFQPDVVVRTGACLFQWAGSRRRAVLKLGGGHCPSWEVQIEQADHEMRTLFPGFFHSLRPFEHMRNHFGRGRRG